MVFTVLINDTSGVIASQTVTGRTYPQGGKENSEERQAVLRNRVPVSMCALQATEKLAP